MPRKITEGEALPCPFCGESELEMNGPGGLFNDPDCFIQCITCTTTGPNGVDFESAIIQWNEREVIESKAPSDPASAAKGGTS
jgi:Lar family restriction alleviation protein